MTNDKLIKKVFNSYVLISVLAMFAAMVGMIVDGIVIGRVLGQQSVSAFGLAGPLYIFIAAVAGIFSNGGSSCASNHIGRGDKEKINLNFTITMAVSFIIAVFFTLICIFFSRGLAIFLGAKGEELINLTSDYIIGLGIGIVPTMLSQVLTFYIRLDNDATLSFLSILFMTVTNIVFDLLFALVFSMGMFGMGLATSISYLVSLLVCCIHFLKKNNQFAISSLKGSIKELKDVFFSGIPSALNRACITFRGIVLNRLLLFLSGSIAVSALAVQNNINNIISSITMGVGLTTLMIAGIFFGERDNIALEKTLKVSLKTGVILSTVTGVIIFIFAPQAVSLFLKDGGEVKEIAVRSLRFFCLNTPFTVICTVMINFYQCTRKLFMANIICVGYSFAFVLLSVFVLMPFIQTDAVWISFVCGSTLTVITMIVIIRKITGKWPKTIKDIMLLSDDFAPDKEKTLDVSIKNDIHEVMELSGRIYEFCNKYTEDKEKIQHLSLCIEEMAGYIVRYGFNNKKEHSIDIRVIIKDEDIIFRMRDDGIPFNPLNYSDDLKLDTSEKMGITIIRKIAKEMDYRYTIGLNNLTVVL